MELAFAFFAKAAEFLPDGRFSALGGGIEAVRSRQLPATIDSLCLVLKFRLKLEECRAAHRVRIRPRDPEGRVAAGDFTYLAGPIPSPAGRHLRSSLGITVSLTGFPISKTGEYHFHIDVDERPIGVVGLYSEVGPLPDPSRIVGSHGDA
ncbi:DUF6941 family protein [Singulisphaera rosea]